MLIDPGRLCAEVRMEHSAFLWEVLLPLRSIISYIRFPVNTFSKKGFCFLSCIPGFLFFVFCFELFSVFLHV